MFYIPGESKNGYSVSEIENDQGVTYTSMLKIERPSSDESEKLHKMRIQLKEIEKR